MWSGIDSMLRLTRSLCLSALLALPPLQRGRPMVPDQRFLRTSAGSRYDSIWLCSADMRQSPATFATSERPSIEFDFGYQNTWALSEDVERYLQSRPRSPLTPADVANIRALPGEQFLVDAEVALLDVTFNYPITNRLGMYATLSAASYHGGWMDGVIENFHRAFGFEPYGRPGLTRGQVNLLFDLKDIQYTELDRPSDRGLLDPVLGLHYALMPKPNSFNVVLDAAIKVPLGGDEFFSTGRVTWRATNCPVVYRPSCVLCEWSARVLRRKPRTLQRFVADRADRHVGYEFRWLQNTNLIAQFYVSRSTVRGEQTDLDELRSNKYQVSLGLRQRLQRGYVSAAFTENLQNVNNTPDFGFQISAGFNF